MKEKKRKKKMNEGGIFKERKRERVCERLSREFKRGKYHCTIDLLFEWFGLVCYANKNKNCQLSYS